MRGRVCLVTGATSGHGRAVAAALAGLGGDVILLGRNPEKCARVREAIAREKAARAPDVLLCDLARREEVDRAARELLDSGRPLHVLVNNAGLVNLRRQETPDGVETTFAVNYLAHFQLTLRLLPLLRASAPARIVNVSSDTHRIARLDLDDLELRRRYSWLRAYARSKLAIVYFTRELARRLEGSGVTANAVDPGPVASGIGANNAGLAYRLLAPAIGLFPSPERAARTAVELAASPELAEKSGGYYKFGRERRPRLDSRRPELGRELWAASARMTGVDA
jgi:NAD(P)-dependent dehydrogenase (short-subunit alcohol dehydrogenase family)